MAFLSHHDFQKIVAYWRRTEIETLKSGAEGATPGYVRLVDVMGSDEAIVRSARMSTRRGDRDFIGDTKEEAKAEGLLRYLIRHHHTTPVETGARACFELKMPVFVYRQNFRHRSASQNLLAEEGYVAETNDTSFMRYSVNNEMSARYSELPKEWWLPSREDWRAQSKSNHQGSSDDVVGIDTIADSIYELPEKAFHTYHQLLEKGTAKELARCLLPNCFHTKLVWNIDLHNLFHYLGLRMHGHAQKEIRDYAEAIARIVADIFPVSWKAFTDFRLGGMTWTKPETEVMQQAFSYEWALQALRMLKNKGVTKRELKEFWAKVRPGHAMPKDSEY